MARKFTKNGIQFEMTTKKNGNVVLSYLRSKNGLLNGQIYVCDDEAEAMDMIEAVIDPDRYADDEYKARHINEFVSRCKW